MFWRARCEQQFIVGDERVIVCLETGHHYGGCSGREDRGRTQTSIVNHPRDVEDEAAEGAGSLLQADVIDIVDTR